MVFNLDFAKKIILSSCFFSLFFNYWLILLIPAVITQVITEILKPSTELAMSIGIPTKEAKDEIKTQPVTAEIKITKFFVLLANQIIMFYLF